MEIDNYMTINEAAERWNKNEETLKKRIKPSTRNEEEIQRYIKQGLIKYYQKAGAKRGEWIITSKLMEKWYGPEPKK